MVLASVSIRIMQGLPGLALHHLRILRVITANTVVKLDLHPQITAASGALESHPGIVLYQFTHAGCQAVSREDKVALPIHWWVLHNRAWCGHQAPGQLSPTSSRAQVALFLATSGLVSSTWALRFSIA